MTAPARNGPLAQGVVTMVGFGIVWAVVGVVGLTSSGPARVAGIVVAVLAGIAVAVVALRSPPGQVARGAGAPNPEREFLVVNAAQAVLILVAVVVCVALDVPVLIAPAACLVVGLHFLPLSRIFGLPLYRATGGILLAVAVVGFVLAAVASDDAVLVLVGLAAAVTLWCTALLLPRYA